MKRYGYLYDKVCDVENIKLAIRKASKGKKNRINVQKVLADIDKYALRLSEDLKNHRYNLNPYTEAVVVGGTNKKERIIHKPKFYPDQCIHWAVYLQIAPILQKGFYEYSCGSIPGRGQHYGKRAVVKWLKNDVRGTKYYLKLDIKKFYPSVRPELVKDMLRKKFKDPWLLDLLYQILDMFPELPIGILLSQWFGNFVLSPVDRSITADEGCAHYIRYMDDMVVFGSNKRKLHRLREKIQGWLKELGLTLKGNWQVCRFNKEALDFMGFRFFRDKVIMRKAIMYQITRQVRKLQKQGVNPKLARGMISYMGWIKHTNSRTFYNHRVKPYVNIKQLKIIIKEASTNDYLFKREYSTAC